jgi:hypothetical protein
MHSLWLLSFFSTNRAGAAHDDELGRTYPFCSNSLSCVLSSINSRVVILYGLLAIGAIPGIRSMANLISWFGGRPGSSSGNTSGYSFTMGTCSGFSTLRLWRVGLGRLDWMWQVTVFPRWLVTMTALSAQVMVPRCLIN